MRKSNPKVNDDVKSSNERTVPGKNRNLRKSKNKRKFRDSNKDVDASTNDPAWYGQSPELLRDSSSIPFSWSTGTTISQHWNDLFKDKTFPGVATIELKQVIGETSSRHDPVNVAADAIYSFVRHANSGHSNYDAPDLMMYLLGMSSVYSFITWCQRLLGLIMMYDQRNRYLPDTLVRANSVDPVDLRRNIANFRFWLNNFIAKASSFAIPNVMPYFSRMAFIYSNYYIDGPSIKDQFYMYVPSHNTFLAFYIATGTGLGFLREQAMPMASTYATVSEIEAYGEQLFSNLWNQEDFGIMSGDILKAYGENIIKLAPMPEMLMLQPVYDPMFLHQFKNAKCLTDGATFVGDIAVNEDGFITQNVRLNRDMDPSILACYVRMFAAEQILSSDYDAPTPEVVMESTRLMPALEESGENYRLLRTGSEIPLAIHFWVNNKDMIAQNVSAGGRVALQMIQVSTVDASRVQAVARILALASKFKYAPEIDVFAGELSATIGYLSDDNYQIWDVDNYAVLDSKDLTKMHQAAFMSMLAVPSIAKIQ